MRTAVVYHIFQRTPLTVRAEALDAHPIILSIATLRAFYGEDIFVIDKTRGHIIWGEWPERFKFTIVPNSDTYPRVDTMSARTLDIEKLWGELGHTRLVYSDADIFWTKTPQLDISPYLATTLIYDDPQPRVNTGFFHVDKHTHGAETFHAWADMTRVISDDADEYERIRKAIREPRVTDEGLLSYMCRQPGTALHQQSQVAEAHMYRGHAGVHVLGCLTRDCRTACFRMEEVASVLDSVLVADERESLGYNPRITRIPIATLYDTAASL